MKLPQYYDYKRFGFTLIELVIVIAIIGILAAFAIPRFVDLSSQAIQSVNAGNFSSFRSATALGHSRWLLNNKPTSFTMNGTTINYSSSGWPGGNSPGASGCVLLWNTLMTTTDEASSSFVNGGSGYYTLSAGSYCYYIYQKRLSPLRYLIYDTSTGVISSYNP